MAAGPGSRSGEHLLATGSKEDSEVPEPLTQGRFYCAALEPKPSHPAPSKLNWLQFGNHSAVLTPDDSRGTVRSCRRCAKRTVP